MIFPALVELPSVACVRGSTMVPLVGNICTVGTNLITNVTIGKEIGVKGKNGNAIGTNGTNVTNQWYHWENPEHTLYSSCLHHLLPYVGNIGTIGTNGITTFTNGKKSERTPCLSALFAFSFQQLSTLAPCPTLRYLFVFLGPSFNISFSTLLFTHLLYHF